MFVELVEGLVGLTDAEIDEELRASELAARAHAARHAALVALAAARGTYRDSGHRSMAAYLRATVNTSGGSISRALKLARLVDAHPAVGEALLAGRISADHALEIAVVHGNRRISHLLGHVVDVLVEQAEHRSLDEFHADIAQFVTAVDQDGAFRDVAHNVDHRNARVTNLDGCVDVAVSGGDPIVAEQLSAIFAVFVEREFSSISRHAERSTVRTPIAFRSLATLRNAGSTPSSPSSLLPPPHRRAAPFRSRRC